MKIILSIIIFVCSIWNAIAQKGFILEGTIAGLKNGTVLQLTKNLGKDTVGKCIIKDNHFIFNGYVANGTDFYFIKMDTLIKKSGSNGFLLENGNIKVIGNLEDWPNLNIFGSKPHDERENANQVYINLRKGIDTVNIERGRYAEEMYIAEKTGDSISYKKLLNEYNKLDAKEKSEDIKLTSGMLDYIKKHLNSLYTPRLIMLLVEKEVIRFADMELLYSQLGPNSKGSSFGIALEKRIKMGELKADGIIPDFIVSKIDEGTESIRNLAKQGKYTLIDFWASWCVPCREEIPNMKKVYSAFHSKGFNIIGISSDRIELAWKKAIKEDKTEWFHGRDNLDNASNKVFGITAIPAFMLVDQEAKLIAFEGSSFTTKNFGPKLRGDILYKTIGGLLDNKK